MTKTVKVYIYGLRESGTVEIRYVGQSLAPQKRLRAHRRHADIASKHPKKVWVGEVYARGNTIEMDILEECTWDNAGDREAFWMDYYRSRGKLTNVGSAKRKGGEARGAGKNVSFYLSKEQIEKFREVQSYYGMNVSKTVETLVLEYYAREIAQ